MARVLATGGTPPRGGIGPGIGQGLQSLFAQIAEQKKAEQKARFNEVLAQGLQGVPGVQGQPLEGGVFDPGLVAPSVSPVRSTPSTPGTPGLSLKDAFFQAMQVQGNPGFDPQQLVGILQSFQPGKRQTVTTSPGQRVTDIGTGETIVDRKPVAPPEKTFEAKIRRLKDQGVPEDVATKVATGVFQETTDAFGRSVIIDLTTREKIWPKPAGTPDRPKLEDVSPTIVGGAEGTGGAAVLKNTVNFFTDFFGVGLQFKETAEITDQLKSLKTFSMLSIAGDLPGRPTNLVRERIEALFPEPSSLQIGDARSLSKLKAVRDEFMKELPFQQRIVDNPERVTPKIASEAMMALQNMTATVEVLNSVIDNWNVKPGQPVPTGGQGDQEGDTATHPTTGAKMVFRNGQWVPLTGAR